MLVWSTKTKEKRKSLMELLNKKKATETYRWNNVTLRSQWILRWWTSILSFRRVIKHESECRKTFASANLNFVSFFPLTCLFSYFNMNKRIQKMTSLWDVRESLRRECDKNMNPVPSSWRFLFDASMINTTSPPSILMSTSNEKTSGLEWDQSFALLFEPVRKNTCCSKCQ